MSDSPTKIVLIAASVIITVGLISLAAFEYGRASGTVKTMSNSLLEQSNEWDMSSLASLDGKELTGSEVASLIRKYKSEYLCKVQLANGNPAQVYTSVKPFINSTDSSDYIKPNSIFKCTLDFQGVSVSVINFDEESVNSTTIASADDAKRYLVSKVQNNSIVSLNSTWDGIADTLNSTGGSIASAKIILGGALGYSSTESTDTAKMMLDAAEQIKTLGDAVGAGQDVITESGSDSDSCVTADLSAKTDYNNDDERDFNLPRAPRLIIAYDKGSSNLQMLSEIVKTSTSGAGQGDTNYAGLGWINQSGAMVNQSSTWCNYIYTNEGGCKLHISNASQKALKIIVFY